MPSQSKEYANQNTKYAISIKRLRQREHQLRHLNQKNMPTKTPSMPSQSKDYTNQNTKYAISTIKDYANQNTKYAILIKRLCQPNKIPSTPSE